MPLTFGDLIQTSEERVVFTGDQIPEFIEMLKQWTPMTRGDLEQIEKLSALLPDKIVGYKSLHSFRRRHPGTLIGVLAGREWYAESEAKPRMDWNGEHGLNIQQMQFARMILHAVHEMTGTPADAHFEQTLVTAMHAYAAARTERLNFFEAEYRRMIDLSPRAVLWPESQALIDQVNAKVQEVQKTADAELSDEALLAKTDATDDWRHKEPKS